MSRTYRPRVTERRRMWAASRFSEKRDKQLEHRRVRTAASTALRSENFERAEYDPPRSSSRRWTWKKSL